MPEAATPPPPLPQPRACRPATSFVPVAPVAPPSHCQTTLRPLSSTLSSTIRREPSSLAAARATNGDAANDAIDACCGIRWGQAGRIYLLIGGALCCAGAVTLLATGLSRKGPLWIGPIVACVGLLLLGKGLFDYVRHRVKTRADLPDDGTTSEDNVDDGGGRLSFALPFGSGRRRKRRAASHFRYLMTSGGPASNSWATGYSQQQGTLQPPPRELVQHASLLLTGDARQQAAAAAPGAAHDGCYYSGSMRSSAFSSSRNSSACGGGREPIYFPVMSTSRLPTPAASPSPSVFSLQDGSAAAAAAARGGGGGLGAPRRISGVSAPNLFDSLTKRAAGSQQWPPLRQQPPTAAVGRSSRARLLLPSRGAARLSSHKEEA